MIRAYGEPGRLMLQLERADAGPAYVRIRIASYHNTCAMERLMKTALAKATMLAQEDTDAARLQWYLERHLVEEAHDPEVAGLDLRDLAAMGADADAVRRSSPPKALVRLVDRLEHIFNTADPIAILGFLQVEQLSPREEDVDRLIALTGHPPEGFGNIELHALLEPGHACELDRQVDMLATTRWQEDLIFEAAKDTFEMLTEVFLDAIHDRST